jgi:hypothetical protein
MAEFGLCFVVSSSRSSIGERTVESGSRVESRSPNQVRGLLTD